MMKLTLNDKCIWKPTKRPFLLVFLQRLKKMNSTASARCQPSSKSVSQPTTHLPFRFVSMLSSRKPAQRRARYNEYRVAFGGTRLSTLAFRTFGLFRTAAFQRRDLPPPEELFFLPHRVHPLAPAPVPARPRNM